MIQGSCLCGDAAWQVGTPLELASHCHCSICRKMHGTPYATYGAADAASFRWLRGESGLQRYESSPGFLRWFCGRCGSKVPAPPSHGRVFVPLGGLDGDPGVRPRAHIHVASRAPWWEITDSLPRFDALPPGFGGPALPTRARPQAGPGRIAGSCQCGACGYEVDAPIPMLRNCHCSRCRRARSAAHATNAVVPLAQFRWTRGESRLRSYKVPEARFFAQVFCEACGAPMPRLDPSRGIAVLPSGSFDQDPGTRVMEHIFVASKAPWFEISDALPRHPEGPPPVR
jgi:hypothetical protein